jgi:hypothetical protein
MLIGVFSGDVLAASVPIDFSFQCYVEYFPTTTGDQVLHFKFDDGTGKGQIKMKMNLMVHEQDVVGLPLPKITVTFKKKGKIRLYISNDGEKWKRIMTKSIKVGPVPRISSNAVPQLS